MLSNYLKVALRMVLRQKSFVLLNIFGLSIGLAASMLMLLFVMHEFSYDSFHPDAERIVRVLEKRKDWGGNGNSIVETRLFADSSIFPPKIIESIVQVLPIGNYSGKQDIRVSVGGIQKPFFEQEGMYVTPNFFSMFPFPALRGNPHKTLLQPNSIVITERAALRYFGTVEALGKTITFEKYRSDTTQRMYLVGAVIADLPSNTLFQGDLFLPLSGYIQSLKEKYDFDIRVQATTYLRLAENAPKIEILRALQARQKLLDTQSSQEYEYGAVNFFFQPLTDVYANRLGLEKTIQYHLKSGTKANVEQITILGILAFVLMFIACLT
jgi:putative ABC transport system permease protein